MRTLYGVYVIANCVRLFTIHANGLLVSGGPLPWSGSTGRDIWPSEPLADARSLLDAKVRY